LGPLCGGGWEGEERGKEGKGQEGRKGEEKKRK